MIITCEFITDGHTEHLWMELYSKKFIFFNSNWCIYWCILCCKKQNVKASYFLACDWKPIDFETREPVLQNANLLPGSWTHFWDDFTSFQSATGLWYLLSNRLTGFWNLLDKYQSMWNNESCVLLNQLSLAFISYRTRWTR